jgi:hypothetical protein
MTGYRCVGFRTHRGAGNFDLGEYVYFAILRAKLRRMIKKTLRNLDLEQ